MFALSDLVTPLILAVTALLGAAVLDARTVYVYQFHVPEHMSWAGYAEGVLEQKILDELRVIERAAVTRPETRSFTLDSEKKGTLDLMAAYAGVEPLVRAIQSSSELLEYTIMGEVVEVDQNYVLTMRIKHYGGQLTEVHVTRSQTDVDGLIAEAARAVIHVVDPQILCAALLRTALDQRPLNIVPAEKCILDSLPRASYQDRVWLWNLAGVIEFLKGDRAKAAHRLAQALRLSPDFSPALLNLGILYAIEGRHEEAVKAYKMVFRRETPDDSPQTSAATYTEWGTSLVALGDIKGAEEKYAAAIKVDPHYVPAYQRWANLLPGPQAKALRDRATRVARRGPGVYTENLLGVVLDAAPARN